MKRKIAIAGMTAALIMAVSAPVFANLPVGGAVGNVDSTSGAAIPFIGCRIYSRAGADAGINNNTCVVVPSCCANRCEGAAAGTQYRTAAIFNGGGYSCNGENTASYNGDADQQPMYELIDAQANAGACNHIAFYAVQGLIAGSGATTVPSQGDGRTTGCTGTGSNCMQRADNSNASPALTHTMAQFGPTPNQINNAGGLNPNPTPQVSRPGTGCPNPNEVHVTWAAPNGGLMKNGLGSPVKGVHLWKSSSSCGSCPGGDVVAGGWSLALPGTLADGVGGVCVPIAGDTWFATTVVVDGPSNGPTTIETGIVGATGFVGANSQCSQLVQTASRIVLVTARYAGRGTVNVSFRTGTEGGVQGYYVQRGSTPTGPFTRVSDMITPRGDGSDYTTSDKVRSTLGRTMYYQIQVVKSDGTTEVSGVSAVNLPAQKTKKLGDNQ